MEGTPMKWLAHNFRLSAFGAAILILAVGAGAADGAVALRLKDLAHIKEVRPNQLYGIGLVGGLAGTGDSEMLADQLVTNMLQRLHVTMVSTNVTSKNVAAVIVTAEAPAFIMEGSRFDVTVSCLGSATSLVGGVLLQTPLQGADGQVYAVAQGPLLIGGFSAAGAAASTTKNHPTTGRIPDGAILEKRIATVLRPADDLQLVLNMPDYVTAVRAAQSICAAFPDSATPVDAAVIRVCVPEDYRSAEKFAEFVAKVEEVKVTPDSPGRVVVNERTGTIVAGENVRLSAAAISHGNLTISIKETTNTSQPNPGASGETRTEKSTQISAQEPKAGIYVIDDSATLADVARALNLLGVTPRDMVSIFQALKEAGALQCELTVI
jgi:flagellar P-ring protein precursor FlgI